VVVGTGTPASCTEAALRTAVTTATTADRPVTFDCGPSNVSITLTQTIELPDQRNFTLDGGGLITLDGGNTVRLFRYNNANFRSMDAATLTFQRITLSNGRSSGPMLAVQGTTGNCSRGYELEGGGGAIWSRNARLRLIEVSLFNNAGPDLGPDVGGGAVYVVGSLETTVVRSTFVGNNAANGGAIGSLFGGLTVTDSVFGNNEATGWGANGDDMNSGCAQQENGQYQVGSGGLGGAIYADGSEAHVLAICGSEFTGNRGSSLGGAIFRVGYDVMGQGLTVEESAFSENTCEGTRGDGTLEGAAGGIYVQQQDVIIRRTLFDNNSARGGGGGLRLESARTTLENTTFYANEVTRGLGGAIFWSGNSGGTMKNCTLAENVAGGGGGFFAGAIADPGGSSVGNLRVDNCLFVNNRAQDANVGSQCQRTITNGANNVQFPRQRTVGGQDDTLCVAGITFADPQLGALMDNGGFTATALPANGTVTQVGQACPAVDQRGVARASPCTVGAAEL